MNDLISKKAVIDLFEKYQPYMAVSVYEFGMALKALPSAQLEQQWIPWWQEYPDNNRFVLVCNDDGRMAIAQYIGHEVDAYHPWQIAYCPYDVDVWDDDEHGKIVAWQDLPKPYKENNDDERESLGSFERLRSRILSWEHRQDTATQLRPDKRNN